jgi:hypothetical protein
MSSGQDLLSDYVTASRRSQGLPDRVEQPDVLHKVATLLVTQQRSHTEGRQHERSGVRQAAAS